MAERAARHYPDKPAILFEDRCFSCRELDRAASRTAHALAKRGVETGHRVALYLPNIPAFAIAYQAVQKPGAIVVSVSATLTTDELAALLEDSGAGVVFTVEGLYLYLVDRVKDMINTGASRSGRARWRRCCTGIRRSASVRWSACPIGSRARSRRPSWRRGPARLRSRLRARRVLPHASGRVQGAARLRVRGRAAEEPVGEDPQARPPPGRGPAALMLDRPAPQPRAEHVGSFLRPDRLLGAARDARAGRLPAERFRELQDECIREVVAFQEGLGFRTVTDGEFRRRDWSAGFIDAVDGFRLREAALGFRDERGRAASCRRLTLGPASAGRGGSPSTSSDSSTAS